MLASMIGMSKKYGCEFMVPTWKYSEYFATPPQQYDPKDQPKLYARIEEKNFHYDPEFWDQYSEFFKSQNIAIFGWLQSHKYWRGFENDVRNNLWFDYQFTIRTTIKSNLALQNHRHQNIVDPIAISVRQGDYRNNENYQLLPVKYYLGALEEHFPDWRKRSIFFFSDDMDYCKMHFGCLPNAFFFDKFSDIEQLYLMSLCSDFILANSTFSYWGAMLSKLKFGIPENRKVIRPHKYFDGPLAEICSEKDFWPEEWISYDHTQYRYNLLDCTFTIPVYYDSKDRLNNFKLSTKNITENFIAPTMVGEQGIFKKFNAVSDEHGLHYIHRYTHFDSLKHFHRTKILNDLFKDARDHGIVINWDADILIPPLQIIEAVRMLRANEADVVYPYDGRFARVNRRFYNQIDKYNDIGILSKEKLGGMDDGKISVGGAVMWRSDAFKKIGMENENFISYGPEDNERYHRMLKLGLRVARVKGALYHIDHIASMNSGTGHQHFKKNVAELKKVEAMSAEELTEYVQSWEWNE